MVLYRAIGYMDLDRVDGIDIGNLMNKHAILESSMRLYRRLQKTKKTHRSVVENQLYEVRLIESEHPIISIKDVKEHLVHQVVNKMITF